MAWETAAVIAVPMLLEALSNILNIPKQKLEEYYQDSQAFRDYITSLTSSLNSDIENELMQVTPSTTPRFDIPWITEELKKKQDAIFNIKKQISEIQTKAHQSANQTFDEWYNQTPHLGGGIANLIAKPFQKEEFRKMKKEEADRYTKQISDLNNKAQQIKKAPLKNNNPTYQSIQERRRNARTQK